MYNIISFEDTKHDSHCQRCTMYGMCLGLGNQNRTTCTTHSGKMSLQWLTTFLNLRSDLSAVLFLSLYLKSRKIPRWKSIVQKDYFPKRIFFFGRATLVQLNTTFVYFVHLLCMVCRNNVGIHHNFHSGGYRMFSRSPNHHN